MSKINAPLYERLVAHHEQSQAAFHIPGHKGGRSFNSLGAKFYKELLKLDLTELLGLDDLHQPTAVIGEAEQLAAELFHAERTFFLVNGTTAGNLAMVLAACNAGEKLIVERNVHKSVVNGLLLARAKPVFVASEIDEELGVAAGISLTALSDALDSHPDAKGVLITNPNYYGMTRNINEISCLVHQYGMPLLVDEAHGAHFGFHPDFPQSAMQQGADVVVQSTHKMLSAMGMGSMLHLRGKLVDPERVRFFLAMVLTTSPSYPIMASLDLTRAWIAKEGSGLWRDVLRNLVVFYERMEGRLQQIELVGGVCGGKSDPLKLTIHIKSGTTYEDSTTLFTGGELNQMLQARQIYTELADLRNVLCVFSAGTTAVELDLLAMALLEIDGKLVSGRNERLQLPTFVSGFEEIDLTTNLAGKHEIVPLEDAANRVAAAMIIPYPPGVPVIQLGERISSEMIEYLEQLLRAGISIHGVNQVAQGEQLRPHVTVLG
jgi:arginine/lysine/ornithine decarboxylase